MLHFVLKTESLPPEPGSAPARPAGPLRARYFLGISIPKTFYLISTIEITNQSIPKMLHSVLKTHTLPSTPESAPADQ